MFILGNQLSRKYLFLSLCSCGFDDLVEEEENQLGHLWIRRATRERSPVNDLIVSPTLAHPDRAAIVFKGRSRAGQVRCDHLSKSNLFVAPNGSSINEHVARLYGWVLWGLIFCTINRERREERRRGREKKWKESLTAHATIENDNTEMFELLRSFTFDWLFIQIVMMWAFHNSSSGPIKRPLCGLCGDEQEDELAFYWPKMIMICVMKKIFLNIFLGFQSLGFERSRAIEIKGPWD